MLDICSSFFDYLNLHNIRYCHWKSNSHLDEALNGETDLDILVHQDDIVKFRKALEEFPIKKILAPKAKRFPGLEDYLGFDENTGKLIHLHVHYRLVLGQKFIKNHHLPVEAVIFNNLTKIDGVFVPCHEAELILLVIRAHMKVGNIEVLKMMINELLGRASTPFDENITNEFYALIGRSNHDKMLEILQQFELPLSEDIFTSFVAKFPDNRLKSYDLLNGILRIFSSLRHYRRQKNPLIYVQYSYLLFRTLPIIRRFMKANMLTLAGTGKTFALVGADGSGKSTLVTDTAKWLSWRMSVGSYYYGIPKTVKNLIPFTIRQFDKLRLRPVAALLRYGYFVYLAKKKYEVSQRSGRDILSGKIVLTDRYPLREFRSMSEPMDGPQLSKCRTKMGSFFSKIEVGYFEKIVYPDRLFILQVDIDNLRKRKNDLPFDYHLTKAEAVNAVRGNKRTILIDANKSYFDVQLEIKRKIWELL